MKKYIPYIFLVVFSIPLFFLNVPDAHSLGDDFAQYIKEADNIAKGKPYYQSNYIFNNLDRSYAPPQYPSGYPLLLAPVVRIYGIAIRPMLYMNSLIVAALLFALFAYFRKYTSALAAICMSLIIVYSNVILDGKGQVLSDIPCMLFVTLYLVFRNHSSFSLRRTLLLIVLATMVILIRSQGLILIAAEGLFFFIALARLVRSRQWSVKNAISLVSLRLVAGTLILFMITDKIIFYTPHGTFNYYFQMTGPGANNTWTLMGHNINYLLTLFLSFLTFSTADPFWQVFATIIGYAAVVFAAMGLIMSASKNVRVDDVIFLLMCGMVVYMPVHQGPRVLFEIFPVYLLYSYTSMSAVLPGVLKLRPKMTAVLITAIYLVLGYDTCKKWSENICEGCVPSAGTSVFFDYIRTHVNDSDIVVFPRPRLFTLYTDKKAVVYASNESDDRNRSKFDELNVKYIMPWFDENLARFMRAKYVVIDSQVLGDATLYRVR